MIVLYLIYIPIWLYSNIIFVALIFCEVFIYIPIWLYSNYFDTVIDLNFQCYLHSNLVIFKYICTFIYQITTFIYIPIWLYSNKRVIHSSRRKEAFTFQSGYIQIICSSSTIISKSEFTFQSGYIQIGKKQTQ